MYDEEIFMDVDVRVVGQQCRDLCSTMAASAHSIYSKLGKSEGGSSK